MTKSFRKIGAIITIIASMATIVALWYQLSPAYSELTIDTYYSDNPTNIPKVKNLFAEFKFHNKKIDNLVILQAKFTNTGRKTIIGEGTNKNILKNSFLFSVEDNYKIISIEKLITRDISISSTFQSIALFELYFR